MAIDVRDPSSQGNRTGPPPRSDVSGGSSGNRRPARPPQNVYYNSISTSNNTTLSNAAAGLSRPKPLRVRSDSAGSTSGAFAPLPGALVSPTKTSPTKSGMNRTPSSKVVVSPDGKEHRKKKKRTPKKAVVAQTPSPEKLIGAEMDLSEIASAAMASMGHDDLLGGGIVSANHKTSSPIVTRETPPRAPLQNKKSSGLLSEGDTYFRSAISNAEADDAGDGPMLNFEPVPKYGKPLRDESLQYSDANMDSVFNSLKMPLNNLAAAPQQPLSREVSLFGTNFLDDTENGKEVISKPKTAYGAVMPASNAKFTNGATSTMAPYASSYQVPSVVTQEQQQEDIARFSSMVQESAYAPLPTAVHVTPPTPQSPVKRDMDGVVIQSTTQDFSYDSSTFDKETSWQQSTESAFLTHDGEEEEEEPKTCCGRIRQALDPLPWVNPLVVTAEDGSVYYDEPPGVVSRFARNFLYTPEDPEFTSLQQFSWALFLGIFMGVYTALWKNLIEYCVEFMWKTVPERLYDMGLFTDLDGRFPLPHYMWMCPAIFGGILSYIFVVLPKQIPGQNEWIKSLHSRGVQEPDTFLNLFVLSTAGMASGLSLGPELPLILTGGMIGSFLGVVTRQSILSARAMNLTAASAAVAGFFGFPMAGALFVLEVPHRMGLQYFEALSPATIASIVAVLVNRMILKNDVTGYYNYPFLTTTLPSHIFYIAIVYGLIGAGVGVLYCDAVKKLKVMVHDWFHVHDDEHHGGANAVEGDVEQGEGVTNESFDFESKELRDVERKTKLLHAAISNDEGAPLIRSNSVATQKTGNKVLAKRGVAAKLGEKWNKVLESFGIRHEPTRAAVAGTLAGFLTGIICMFVPHVLFWGEAQLQTLIDKGRTPLPVFGEEGEPTSALIAYGYCLIDSEDADAIEAGFSVGCAALISVAKVLVVGLSLGTGIVGGHFWGPLFVGCVASHLFTDVMEMLNEWSGIGIRMADFPCVAILCIMGSTHVVTFRAHMAIMLILTLTISAFYPDQERGGPTAGDYSAVFPLLVVSCFVSVMATRGAVFYKEQRCRGDIMAAPEVLCEPGKEGTPMVVDYVDDVDSEEDDFSYYSTSDEDDDPLRPGDMSSTGSPEKQGGDQPLTQSDIERAFEKAQEADRAASKIAAENFHDRGPSSGDDTDLDRTDSDRGLPHHHPSSSSTDDKLSAVLSRPMDKPKRKFLNRHRRVRSTTDIDPTLPLPSFKTPGHSRSGSMTSTGRRSRSNSMSSRRSGSDERLTRVSSFGELKEFHPSLFDGARQRAASVNRPPSLPKATGRHSRRNSEASTFSDIGASSTSAALTQDDVERSYAPSGSNVTQPRRYIRTSMGHEVI